MEDEPLDTLGSGCKVTANVLLDTMLPIFNLETGMNLLCGSLGIQQTCTPMP